MSEKFEISAPAVAADNQAPAPGGFKQRILEAAARCVERRGLLAVTIEDIVVESGVSRATVYRQYRNRELLLADLMEKYFSPPEAESARLMQASANFSDGLEAVFVWSVTSLVQRRWLGELFKQGLSAETFNLFSAMYGSRAHASMRPQLERAQKNGELRAGLDLAEIVEWFLQQILFAYIMGPTDKATLAHKFRCFVWPVLAAEHVAQTVSPSVELSGELERRLTHLQATVDQIQGRLEQSSQ